MHIINTIITMGHSKVNNSETCTVRPNITLKAAVFHSNLNVLPACVKPTDTNIASVGLNVLPACVKPTDAIFD
jgi:hypothetical protein